LSKTVSARIPNQTHTKLCEMSNKAGCTINEWLCAAIDYIMTGSSEFDFGDEVDTSSDPEKPKDSHEVS